MSSFHFWFKYIFIISKFIPTLGNKFIHISFFKSRTTIYSILYRNICSSIKIWPVFC